ncbi:HAD family hydrolase [Streptomyces sp. NPDC058092]|uniref:HAD family hydrolase n=1 Tax=Streptomyces sp. NPDC058092 TaxID=3346336 RepID=UPI0036E3AB12
MAATDLDGTLLRSDHTFSQRTLTALGRAKQAAVRHVLVTGRPAAGCAPFFDQLGYSGPAVCGQGAQIYDASAGRLLSSASLSTDLARSVVERISAEVGPLALAVALSGLNGQFVVTPEFGASREMRPYTLVPRRRIWDEPIDKVFLRHATLTDGDLAAVAARSAGDAVSVTHSGPDMVEILPLGIRKSVGLARVAQHYAVRSEDVIAFGDMPNDIPILNWAGYGVAMANCHPELKAVADEVAPSHDEDGVAAVLERFLALAPSARPRDGGLRHAR